MSTQYVLDDSASQDGFVDVYRVDVNESAQRLRGLLSSIEKSANIVSVSRHIGVDLYTQMYFICMVLLIVKILIR